MKTNNKISAYILRGTTAVLLFSCVIVALCSAIHLPGQAPKTLPVQNNTAFGANRTLSFAERVAYQTAIEDVYWRHRIWPATNPGPKPPLDKVMSQADIEKKVTDYLRNSQALEDYNPITADQLQAEMERMASHTKQPEVLQELFEALGSDPFVIAECLARPILTDRLIADVLTRDKTGRLEFLRTYELQASNKVAAIDSIAKAVQVNRPYRLPLIASPSAGCIDDTWTPTTLTSAPEARDSHVTVWTGSEMIVWGGTHFDIELNSGGRYSPSTDSWTATNPNAPSARWFPYNCQGAVWTGSEMIVWGGLFNGGLNTGGRYNPSTNSWIATSTIDAPEGRWNYTPVWTGSEMIVWGGAGTNNILLNTGGRYSPATDSWADTNVINAPSRRSGHTAVWNDSGHEMIVWGGFTGSNNVNTGGRYNPSTNSWAATSTIDAPEGRSDHTAVWTDTEMIVWGGSGSSGVLNSGAGYNPPTDTWGPPISTTSAPVGRFLHKAVWTRSEMIVWGGLDDVGRLNSGGRYNPNTDSWTATSTTNAASARVYFTAIWTGIQMIVWGGYDGMPDFTNTGGKYCAAAPTPTPTPSPSPTATATATVTATASATATATATATPTATASSTARPTPTPRARPTPAPRP